MSETKKEEKLPVAQAICYPKSFEPNLKKVEPKVVQISAKLTGKSK
jgi:hypothetical protein